MKTKCPKCEASDKISKENIDEKTKCWRCGEWYTIAEGVIVNTDLTTETEHLNRWLIFSITTLVAFVQAHAVYWGALKRGMWPDVFRTNSFNLCFDIFIAFLAYFIVISCIKHSQRLAKKNVRTYQAYSMVNNVAFSIFVADHLPGFFLMIPAFIEGFKEGAAVEDIAVTYIAAQNLFILFIVKLFQIVRFPVLAFVILYMPAFRRKRTVTYRIYLCILSIMTLIAFVNCWRNCTATVGFFSSLVRFLSEAPEAILTNDFQFLPVDFFIPAILSIILSFFILPITTIYSIFWKELS